MKDAQFKIVNIEKDKSLFGETVIEAINIENNVSVRISVPNTLATREIIKEELIKEYNQQIIRRPIEKPIEVGDIL